MPKVFISYARDGGVGEVLAAEVQTQLQQQNFEVFRDVIGLKPGDVWYHKLEFELESSDFVVLVVSEKVRTSKWVHNEVSMAEEIGLPVIPVLAEKIRSPLWLRHLQALDFCGQREWGRLFEVLGVSPVVPAISPVIIQPEPEILVPAWAQAADTDQYGKYADLDVKGVVQRFRWIEPGTFMMGSPENEKGRGHYETQHEVIISRGFWMADTTVTQALWQVVINSNPSRFKGEKLPVEMVDWEDCQKFIDRLNQQYRSFVALLPSEDEWEYACRAGTTTPFAFGENITSDKVNYNSRHPYLGDEKGLYRKKTVVVKNLPPNLWGLYEMHGNVWEWCRDNWQENLDRDIQDGRYEGGYVTRGGSYARKALYCRSACRDWDGHTHRRSDLGFRLILR